MRIVDVTMFWAPASGGVRTYLQAKQHWIQQATDWHYHLLIPAAHKSQQDFIHTLPAMPLPFGQGYRFPLRATPWLEALRALKPDIIEVGDPYRLAWVALQGNRA